MVAVYPQSPSDQAKRSGAPKVMGILSIIFASLTMLGSFPMLMATLAADSIGNMRISAGGQTVDLNHIKDQVAGFYGKIMIHPLILLVCSVMLLIIGIGQVRYKAWARKWSLVWGWTGLGAIALLSVLSFLVIGPAYNEMLDGMMKLGGERMFSMSGGLGSFVGVGSTIAYVFFLAPYPIVTLSIFSGKKARDAMVN